MFKWKIYQLLQHMLVLGLAAVATTTRADMIVEIQNATIESGGRGFIDVLVSSDRVVGDTFSLYGYKFEITPITIIAGGVLEFQPSSNSLEPFRQSASEQSLDNYIFKGSTAANNLIAVRQDPNRQQIVGGDSRVAGNFTFTSPNQYLLARLELQHITPTPETSSGSFRVSLIQDPGQSYFQNLDLNDNDPAQPKINPVSYSASNSGLVTVVSSVPEPSSLVMALLACTWCFNRRSRALF